MRRPLRRLPVREATHELFEALGILTFALLVGMLLVVFGSEVLFF